jgi:hypothetical protein
VTLSQFLDVCRARHNAAGDNYWSDEEIYALLTNRINMSLAIIGMIEAYTTDTTVIGTQGYAYPSGASTLYQVNFKNERLKRITFQQAQLYSTDNGFESGRPTMFYVWGSEIKLVPIPSTADTLGIYYYKEHPFIDGVTQTTIDVPSVLHPHYVAGVLSDMYAKDLNWNGSQFYEQMWNTVSIPAFNKFKNDERNAGGFNVINDVDTLPTTELGPL